MCKVANAMKESKASPVRLISLPYLTLSVNVFCTEVQWNLDITKLYITKSSVWRTIFFIPVTAKWMKKNLVITKPGYIEQILPVPWPFFLSRFHCTNWGHSFYVSYWRRDQQFYVIGATQGQRQYLHCSVVLSISTVTVIKSATSRSTVKRSTDFNRTPQLLAGNTQYSTAALLSMMNTINTFVSDNFQLTRGRVNYEVKGKKKNTWRVQVFLSTSCTSGIIFSVNLHRSQLVVLSLLFLWQYGSNLNCLSFTVIFIQRIATRHPEI